MDYQFKVGDKVKATTPTIVCEEFKDVVGVVASTPTHGDDSYFMIRYDDGAIQWAWSKDDGVVLVEDIQCDDDDQREDWSDDINVYYNTNSLEAIVQYDENGGCVRFKLKKAKKPDAPELVEVGKTYTGMNGSVWTCIYVEGDSAWMKGDYDRSTAYVWSLGGKSYSLGPDYNIDWAEA